VDVPASGDDEEGCNVGVATVVRLLSSLSLLWPPSSFFLISRFLGWRSWEDNGYVCFFEFFLLISGCFFCGDYDNSKANSRFYVSCSLVLSFFSTYCFFFYLCSVFFSVVCSVFVSVLGLIFGSWICIFFWVVFCVLCFSGLIALFFSSFFLCQLLGIYRDQSSSPSASRLSSW